MKYRFLRNVKYSGTRYVVGDEIELDEIVAQSIVERGMAERVELPVETPEPLASEFTPIKKPKVNYSEKTIVELREIALEREIDVKGLKKAEIIEALEK